MAPKEYWERDVTVTGNENASPDPFKDKLPPNDLDAQHKAAAQLAYAMHGNACQTCGAAQAEHELCALGQKLYANMRAVGCDV